MIQIQRYREFLIELTAEVNKVSETPIDGVMIAVNEAHMVKKLRDAQGVWLCANYPDADLSGDYDSSEEKNKVLLFVLEKVPSGQHCDADELLHYAKMQQLTEIVKDKLLQSGFACLELGAKDGMRTEWEYDIFGGFNGLSIGLNLTNHDRAIY